LDIEVYNKKINFWSPSSSIPGGKTLEEAHKTAREEISRINRINPKGLKNVRFKIEKSVTETTVVEEINGSEISFFLLKTA
jgi:hypothetical protein